MKVTRIVLASLVACVAVAGQLSCDDGHGFGTTDSDADTDTFDHEFALDDRCPLEDRYGSFEIGQHPGYSNVRGAVKDGVVPVTIWTPQESEGDCRLLRKVNPQCDPACEGGETCDHDGECVPFPSNLSAGTVDVYGLEVALSMEPNSVSEYEDSDVPSPPFAPGSQILLHASGDAVGEFFLDAVGVEPLAVPDNEWVIERDESLVVQHDLEITWTPADGDAVIMATLNIDQHGNSPVTMFCYFDDDGSGTVPTSLLQTFTDWGVTGYATGNLYRQTFDSTQIDLGCVDLQLFSRVEAELSVTNHDPTIVPGE